MASPVVDLTESAKPAAVQQKTLTSFFGKPAAASSANANANANEKENKPAAAPAAAAAAAEPKPKPKAAAPKPKKAAAAPQQQQGGGGPLSGAEVVKTRVKLAKSLTTAKRVGHTR